MIAESRIKLFLVDDDAVFLKLMEIELLQNLEFDVETYSSGELCMASIAHNPDIIILDYNLDGMDKNAMNGIETLNKIKAYNRDIQVVMLSSQNNIDVAIDSVHQRAVEYVVKSNTSFLRIEKIIAAILNFKKMEKGLNWYVERI